MGDEWREVTDYKLNERTLCGDETILYLDQGAVT